MRNHFAKGLCLAFLSLAAIALLSVPVAAHHGTNISYDHAHPITVKGTVTEFIFKNPHAQIYFDVTDDKGNVDHWNGELTNPSNLMHAGWTKKRSEKELPPGTPLTITLAPSKAGTKVGVVLKIINEKGEQVLLGREQQVQ
jgi:Family of unknown function (DUF6152)